MKLSVLEALPEGPGRTAAAAAWFQGLFSEGEPVPVLVGGAAVELYTRGGYTTRDLDFVGDVTPGVARRLEDEGFRREGRHWVHSRAKIFIELPSSSLEPEARVRQIDVEGSTVILISLEDALVDRLASWQFWKSSIDGANAYLLATVQKGRIDWERVRQLSRKREVERALTRLLAFIAGVGDRKATLRELETWSGERP